MDLRPTLRYVYLSVADLEAYEDVATRLRFVPISEATVSMDDTPHPLGAR